eukprot:scaffold1373_cov367-Pinguiococcus_pyrenoidosus.AAC.17
MQRHLLDGGRQGTGNVLVAQPPLQVQGEAAGFPRLLGLRLRVWLFALISLQLVIQLGRATEHSGDVLLCGVATLVAEVLGVVRVRDAWR